MEGPISFWVYKEQESNLILPEHDDDDIPTHAHNIYTLKSTKIHIKNIQQMPLHVSVSLKKTIVILMSII